MVEVVAARYEQTLPSPSPSISHTQRVSIRCQPLPPPSLSIRHCTITQREIVEEKDGKPLVRTFTIPTLASSSIYHEPPSLATLALTESALMRYHSDEPIVLTIGPMPQIETVNAQNRMTVLSYILNIYNGEVALLSHDSLRSLCKMCSILAKSGFDDLGCQPDDTLNDSIASGSSQASRVAFVAEPRVAVSAGFLIECLSGLYFAMFNGHAQVGLTALDHIHMRASYELFADVLLVTNAVRNSLQYNPSGQPEDGPMGIAIALSPTQTTNPAFLKDAITNASFRTKRMPEDIGPEEPEEEKENNDLPTDLAAAKQAAKKASRKDRRKSSSGGGSDPVDSPNTTIDSLRKKLRFRRSSSLIAKEDIEVPADGGEVADNPPHYDDIMENDRTRGAANEPSESRKALSKLQLGKPLKSIMKNKMMRKESDTRRTSGGRSGDVMDGVAVGGGGGHSPRHSASVSGSLSSSFNGEIPSSAAGAGVDPNAVRVEVVQKGSGRTTVDAIEMSSLNDKQHRRTTSFPEDFISSNNTNPLNTSSTSASVAAALEGMTMNGTDQSQKPLILPASHSRELNGGGGGSNKSSSNSLNTHL